MAFVNAPSSSKILAFTRIFIKLKRGSRLRARLKIKDARNLAHSLEGRETVIAAVISNIPRNFFLHTRLRDRRVSRDRSQLLRKLSSHQLLRKSTPTKIYRPTCVNKIFSANLATKRIIPRETGVRSLLPTRRRFYSYFKKPLL